MVFFVIQLLESKTKETFLNGKKRPYHIYKQEKGRNMKAHSKNNNAPAEIWSYLFKVKTTPDNIQQNLLKNIIIIYYQCTNLLNSYCEQTKIGKLM